MIPTYTIFGIRFNRALFWLAIVYAVVQLLLIPLSKWWTPLYLVPLLFVWAWFYQRLHDRRLERMRNEFNRRWAAPPVDIPKFYLDNPHHDYGLNERDIEEHRLAFMTQDQLDELDRQGDLPSARDTIARFKDTHPPQ